MNTQNPLSDKIAFILEYAKHHEPTMFKISNDNYAPCKYLSCETCKVKHLCSETPDINEEDMITIRKLIPTKGNN